MAALALPLALPPGAHALAPGARPPSGAAVTGPALTRAPSADAAAPPGRTQSLRLAPLTADRALGSRGAQGLTRRHTAPFALLGVVWDDPDSELRGRVQIRTHATAKAAWSPWRTVGAHREHAPDPGSAERTARRLRGGTAPMWVGTSDGVQVRVIPSAGGGSVGAGSARAGLASRGRAYGGGGVARDGVSGAAAAGGAVAALPRGLRLELVDPGDGGAVVRRASAGSAAAQQAGSAGNAGPTAGDATVIPARGRTATRADLAAAGGGPYIGARPAIVTRKGWGADESLRESGFRYTERVRAAFVHHTDSGNGYACAEAPEVIRGVYRYHVVSQRWRDIGYNFLIDKCGTVYEGRAGGVDKPVMGAHTMGFNSDSTGIAVIGTFMDDDPPQVAVDAIAKLSAWKLGLSGSDPEGRTALTSAGGNRYRKGGSARLNVVSGHRDGYSTDCPGARLYSKLPAVRAAAARLQGR